MELATRWAVPKTWTRSGGGGAGWGCALGTTVSLRDAAPAAGVLPRERRSWFRGIPAGTLPPDVGMFLFIAWALIEHLLRNAKGSRGDESDTIIVSCLVSVSGRKCYWCVEDVTFERKLEERVGRHLPEARRRKCQVFPYVTQSCQAAVHFVSVLRLKTLMSLGPSLSRSKMWGLYEGVLFRVNYAQRLRLFFSRYVTQVHCGNYNLS